MTPEQQARETIDALLTNAGWVVRNAEEVNAHAHRGAWTRRGQFQRYTSSYNNLVPRAGEGQLQRLANFRKKA